MIFIHPSDTAMPPNLNFGPCKHAPSHPHHPHWPFPPQVVEEFPFDTCRAITSIIHSGILLRCPNVRFLFSHNGGAFPYLADRIGSQHLDNVITTANSGLTLRDLLRKSNVYFDTSISSPMQYPLIQDLGIPSERLLYATDYPYTMRFDNETYLAGYEAPMKSGVFSDGEMEGILFRNSLSVFPRLKKLYEEEWKVDGLVEVNGENQGRTQTGGSRAWFGRELGYTDGRGYR
jgi:6-methylsalicylate decarboxylase